ncbi:MAG: phage head closure protein [Oribacterium sp.]|nr:phage head closure protein [Oribacterium sp.]
MKANEVIKLVKVTIEADDYGNSVEVKNEREVFAEIQSVTRAEFYQAAQADIRPTIVFVLEDYYDYEGEKLVKYQPYNSDAEKEYRVIRTYRDGQRLEISAMERVI